MSKVRVDSIFVFRLLAIGVLIATWIICVLSEPPIRMGGKFWATFTFCVTQFVMTAAPVEVVVKDLFKKKLLDFAKGLMTFAILTTVCCVVIFGKEVPNADEIIWGVMGFAAGFLFKTDNNTTV